MRLTPFARRSAAIAAATALISSGGAVTGLLTGTAFAVLPQPTVTTITPSQWDNRTSVTMTLTGTNFVPGQDLVVFKPAVPDADHEVNEFSVVSSSSSTPTQLAVKVPLAMAPAGQYRVVVRHAAPDNTESATPANPNFTVTSLGAANARSVAYGTSASGVDPFGVDCQTGAITDCSPRAGVGETPLDISGSNFAVGAKVNLLVPGATPTADAGITFLPGNPQNGANQPKTVTTGTGYPSTTLLQGNYTLANDASASAPGFTPGRHLLQVVNTDGLASGTTTDFWVPWFKAADVAPNALGAGVSTRIVTVTGQGIRAGSRLVISNDSYLLNEACSGVTDVVVGNSSVNGSGTAISAPVTVAGCSHATPRRVTIVGPDGGVFARAGAFTVLSPPTVVRANIKLGQGATARQFTLTGTGFVNGATEADRTAFSYGPGVTVHTIDVPTTTQAVVEITVANDAAVGNRTVTVTNPNDGGSTTTGSGGTPTTWPLTLVEGPNVTDVSTTSFPRTTPSTVSVTAKGSGFDDTSPMLVSVVPDNTGVFITQGTVTKAGTSNPVLGLPATDEVTFTVDTANAAPGLYDLVFTNGADQGYGRFVCTGCLGVDSLGVVKVDGASPGVPAQASNAGPHSLTFEGQTVLGLGLDKVTSAATATLTHLISAPGQPAIAATGALVPGANGSNQATGTFDLTNVAPGKYNVSVKDTTLANSPTWTCTGCFTVTAPAFTTTTLAPTSGGQGAVNRAVTFTGTGFTKGMSVSIPQVTVHDVVFVDPTTITAQLDIPADATPTANETVTVTAGDGTKTTNLTFSVTAAPAVTSITPAALGQGAGTPAGSTLKVSVKGTNIASGASLSLADSAISLTGTSVSADPANSPTCSLTSTCAQILQATIQVGPTATVGKHDVTVINGDGGQGQLAGGFTVNPGPKLLSVADETGAPALRPDGTQHLVTIEGSGFDVTKGVTLGVVPLGGITLGTVTVVSASQITVQVTVPTGETRGARTISVLNTGDSGYGECAASPNPCAYVAVEPGAPASLALASGAQSLKATWTAPVSDGGAPVLSYRLAYARVGVTTPTTVDVPGSARTYTITGLTNSATYNVSLTALNGVGKGLPRTATGVAGLPASLSLAVSTTKAVYGQKVVLTGKLLGTGGVALGGRTIVLAITPAVGRAYTRTVQTVSTGGFAYGLISPYNVKVRALWAGDTTTYRTAASVYRAFTVATRVLISSPANYSKSSASTILRISGTVSPNKRGSAIYLYRVVNGRLYGYAKTYVTSTSTYTFAIKPGRGTWTFRVFMPATVGNAANLSAAWRVYRV